ncbi:hypothetical protein NDU88_013131 [Pleurodeles waltl]|uniref:Uncharacterized protein n=1 Tax=Pleurodeles waltl TaxID=8319 RepID=A0AAV7R3K3_PLEWA|nr:hypothetical protein NDU88_013131 [Pleurodeles waltl]
MRRLVAMSGELRLSALHGYEEAGSNVWELRLSALHAYEEAGSNVWELRLSALHGYEEDGSNVRGAETEHTAWI